MGWIVEPGLMMTVLPIVERELRVAARQARTWWRRVGNVGIGLLVTLLMYWSLRGWNNANTLGRELFVGIGVAATFYCLLAGPLATCDCLTRERREGTLGLLFLTDLNGYDVVLGKMAAASFDFLMGLVAALPLVAIPFMLGGLDLGQFSYVALALFDILFLSLAVGVAASSIMGSGRAALAATVGFLLFLCLGEPFIGDTLLDVGFNNARAAFAYMTCPVYVVALCLGGLGRQPHWGYWVGLAGMQALAWGCLALACVRTRRAWRDLPESGLAARVKARFAAWSRGRREHRVAWRETALERNPIRWLEGRDRLQSRLLWTLVLGCVIFWAVAILVRPDDWPDQDWIVMWPVLSHYALCFWMAVQAPRRLADDKQSGALELLLCSPLPEKSVLDGCLAAWRERFGRAFLALVALDVFIGAAYYNNHGGWAKFVSDDNFQLAVYAAVVFSVQIYAFARVGLYHGLVQTSSVKATAMLIGKLGLLPWVSFFLLTMSYDYAKRRFANGSVQDYEVMGSWAVAHLVVLLLFLSHANVQLQARFRALAAQPVVQPWWLRLVRGRFSGSA